MMKYLFSDFINISEKTKTKIFRKEEEAKKRFNSNKLLMNRERCDYKSPTKLHIFLVSLFYVISWWPTRQKSFGRGPLIENNHPSSFLKQYLHNK